MKLLLCVQHRRFPPNLRRKVARYFKKYFEFKTALNEEAILAELDPELRHEVGLFLCHEAVANNWLLSGLPKGALLKLSTALKPVRIHSNHVLAIFVVLMHIDSLSPCRARHLCS